MKKNSEKYNEVISDLKSKIMSIEGKIIVYDKNFDKIKFSSNETNLPLGKLIYFPTLTVVIRCFIKTGELFYPQAYLEDCYYKNMIIYERIIDCSEGIDLDKSKESIKCTICNYYYSRMDYQPYVCNGCHDFSMKIMELSDFFILNADGNDVGCTLLILIKKKQ